MKQLNSKQFAVPFYGLNHLILAGSFTTDNWRTNYIRNESDQVKVEDVSSALAQVPNGAVYSPTEEAPYRIASETDWDTAYTAALFVKFRDEWFTTKCTDHKPFTPGELDTPEAVACINNNSCFYQTTPVYHTGRLGKPIPTVVTHFLTLDNNDIIILWNTTAAPLNSEEAMKLLAKTHYAPVIDQGENIGTTKQLYVKGDNITVVKDEYYTQEITSKRAIDNDLDYQLCVAHWEGETGEYYSLPVLHAKGYEWIGDNDLSFKVQIVDKNNYAFGCYYGDGDPVKIITVGTVEDTRLDEDSLEWEVIE